MSLFTSFCQLGDNLGCEVTLADCDARDQPLVFVNRNFCDLTGYTFEESVGRNCRFLQGPLTDPLSVLHIRESIASRRPVFQDLLNYRKDGTIFWNRLTLVPFTEDEKNYFLGLQQMIPESRVSIKPSFIPLPEIHTRITGPLWDSRLALTQANPEHHHRILKLCLDQIRTFIMGL